MMLGLKSAALSSEYSLVKYEPISNCRALRNGQSQANIPAPVKIAAAKMSRILW